MHSKETCSLNTFGELKAEVLALENTTQKTFKEFVKKATIVSCPINLKKCLLTLRIAKDQVPYTVTLKALKLGETSPLLGKRKTMEVNQSNLSPMLNFII